MLDRLFNLLPSGNNNFEYIIDGILSPFKNDLKNTHQELDWHGEDDVLTHTLMVLNELVNLEEYKSLKKEEQLIVFLAACFHDVGKIVCTKVIDGRIRSYNHGKVGAKMVREYLYKELGFGGTQELLKIREAICLIIKYHSNPVYSANDVDLIRKILVISSNSFLTEYFSIKLLCILSTADVIGRIGNEKEEQVERINLFKQTAISLGVYETNYNFYNNYTKFKYLNKECDWYESCLYDANKSKVILTVGIPGTGKDTYIKNNLNNLPVISLDNIREEFNLKHGDNEAKVINVAKARAKDYLRQNIDFVWNATNVSNMTRSSLIGLFHDYHASVKIIYFETSYQECLKRNKERIKEVLENVINKMISSLVIPENFEAEDVEWIVL